MTQIQEVVSSISHVSGLSLLEQSKQYDELYENELKCVFGDCIELDIPTQKREEDIEKEIDIVFGFTFTSQVSETPNSEVEIVNLEVETTNSEVEATNPEVEEANSSQIYSEIIELPILNELEKAEEKALSEAEQQCNTLSDLILPEVEESNPSQIDSKTIELPILNELEKTEEKVLSEAEQQCNTLVDLIISRTLETKREFRQYLREQKITYQKNKDVTHSHQAIRDSKFKTEGPETYDKEEMNRLTEGTGTYDKEKMNRLFMDILNFTAK